MKRMFAWIAFLAMILGALAQSELPAVNAPSSKEMVGDKIEKASGELSPGAFGTRTSPVSNASSQNTPVGSESLVQMVAALIGVALALRYGLPKLVQWSARSGQGSHLDGEIRVIESRAIAGGGLHLVSARGRLMLLGSTAQGLQLIAEISEPEALTPSSEFENALKQTKTAIASAPQEEDYRKVQSAMMTANEQLRQLLKR